MGRRSQDSTRSPALPGLFDSKTVRPLFLTWAAICAVSFVVGAAVVQAMGPLAWVPVAFALVASLASLWMWFHPPRDPGNAFAWLLSTGMVAIMFFAANNDLGDRKSVV